LLLLPEVYSAIVYYLLYSAFAAINSLVDAIPD